MRVYAVAQNVDTMLFPMFPVIRQDCYETKYHIIPLNVKRSTLTANKKFPGEYVVNSSYVNVEGFKGKHQFVKNGWYNRKRVAVNGGILTMGQCEYINGQDIKPKLKVYDTEEAAIAHINTSCGCALGYAYTYDRL